MNILNWGLLLLRVYIPCGLGGGQGGGECQRDRGLRHNVFRPMDFLRMKTKEREYVSNDGKNIIFIMSLGTTSKDDVGGLKDLVDHRTEVIDILGHVIID